MVSLTRYLLPYPFSEAPVGICIYFALLSAGWPRRRHFVSIIRPGCVNLKFLAYTENCTDISVLQHCNFFECSTLLLADSSLLFS